MSKPLTYQSLKCVVEYLEANKRFLISDRNPAFGKMERQIPLHLDYFCPGCYVVTFNDTTYELSIVRRCVLKNPNGKDDYINVPRNYGKSREKDMISGDLMSFYIKRKRKSCVKYWGHNPKKQPFYISFSNDPSYYNYEEADRRFIGVFFDRRHDIFVKRLEVSIHTNIQLPPSLKLQVQELTTNSNALKDVTRDILSLISGKLETLKINEKNWQDSSFDLPLVQTADKLFIQRIYPIWPTWHRVLLKLPNREITFEGLKLTKREVASFVRGLLNEGREIGTFYTFIGESSRSIFKILKSIGKRYKRNLKQNWKNRLSIREYSVTYSIHLPMTSTSELFIYGTHTRYENHTTMKVGPITPLEPTDFDRLMARVSTNFSRMLDRFK